MGIDWFTFVAQIVNFLILIGLLWHFAYKPIVRAMDEREDSIRSRLEDADEKRREADEKAAELDEKHEKLDARRDELLTEARENAETQRKQLMEEARARVERSESAWRASLRREKRALAQEVQRRAGRHVVGATRRMLQDLAGAELERQIVTAFQRRWRALDDEDMSALRKAVGEANGDVRFVTAFELPAPQREELHQQLAELIEHEIQPNFEQDDALLCGIELQAGSQRVSWNAQDYLTELEDRIEVTIATAGQQTRDQSGDDDVAGDESEGKQSGQKNQTKQPDE